MLFKFIDRTTSTETTVWTLLAFVLFTTFIIYSATRAMNIFLTRAKFDKLYQHYFKNNHELSDVKVFNKHLYRAYAKQFNGEIQVYNNVIHTTQFYSDILNKEFNPRKKSENTFKTIIRTLVENITLCIHSNDYEDIEVESILVLQL